MEHTSYRYTEVYVITPPISDGTDRIEWTESGTMTRDEAGR